MAKIVLTMDGMAPRELVLSKARTTIGRAPHNDLVIDSLAVSAEHATISLVGNDAILEDLNSTNGTQVNGQPIKKHFLQENDLIELAQYRLRYVCGPTEVSPSMEPNRDTGSTGAVAAIKVLNGPNAGRATVITKALTTIGRPKTQVAVIVRRGSGYCIAHVEGAGSTLVNERKIHETGQELVDGDVIQLDDVKVQFILNWLPVC